MISKETTARLTGLVAASTQYCALAEQCSDYEREEWVKRMVLALPTLYIGIQSLSLEDVPTLDEGGYLAEYVDEDLYEKVRRSVAALLGEDDVYLETFEEDMKYSDTPIAASISECLADIFQPLYNFISIVKETDGEQLVGAYSECRENFAGYWAQTLCNVMRALNYLRYK